MISCSNRISGGVSSSYNVTRKSERLSNSGITFPALEQIGQMGKSTFVLSTHDAAAQLRRRYAQGYLQDDDPVSDAGSGVRSEQAVDVQPVASQQPHVALCAKNTGYNDDRAQRAEDECLQPINHNSDIRTSPSRDRPHRIHDISATT